MMKRLCCLLVLVSLVACTPANPPQALDAYGWPDNIHMDGFGVGALPEDDEG
ncbi:hypothetical protein [Salicibibacter kimchii]|uniref:hypothetical protein n=1 Tax=Salicibibacter kimchii TaxID=2099786 RepID=UPI001356B244|nr:hypothetical protein [Salicibibacter kimchii]